MALTFFCDSQFSTLFSRHEYFLAFDKVLSFEFVVDEASTINNLQHLASFLHPSYLTYTTQLCRHHVGALHVQILSSNLQD